MFMAQVEENPQHIYEARAEKIVSIKDGKTKWRFARFLLPAAQTAEEAAGIPHTPLLSDMFPHHLHQWPLKVVCRGWNCPQPKWKDWVHRLAPKFEPIWIEAGVRDAIFSSTYELRYNQEILLGLIEFWCTHTNTFVFPWGEATITLEDVLVLGGYSLVGEVLPMDDLNLDLEVEKITGELENCAANLSRNRKTKRADHAAWLKHFMEEEEKSEYEHAAFLSLWLSRYVFPSLSKDILDDHVFPIAAKLSLGTKVALGPAVLANIYHKLREMQEAFECSLDGTIVVPGHFQLLQVWAFERFPALVLGPKSPMILIGPGEPRMARWHKVQFKLNIPLVRSALRLPDNFEWRPYAADLGNWHRQSFYKEDEQVVFDCLSLDDELLSYVRCLRVSELVGTDGCREKYLPNRVAMQFGMDQDLPSAADVSDFKSEIEFVNILIPSRSFQSGVSLRYYNWWRDCMITREGAIKDALSHRTNVKDLRTSTAQTNGNDEYCHSPVACGKAGLHINIESPSSLIFERPCKTKKTSVYESNDDTTRQFDSSISSVHESVGKRKLAARKTGSLEEKMTFRSVHSNSGEGLKKVTGCPLNPIDIDDNSDISMDDCVVFHSPARSSKPRKDLEERIQQLEKMLGVHYN